MPVTLKDIARETGYSVTTVSRALNDYDDVSPATKALIRRAAQRLGYHPNVTAQRLQRRRTDTLGFVIPTFGPRFSDPFFSEFLAGIGNEAAAHGYDLLVSTRPPGPEEMETYRHLVHGKRVDGLLVVRTRRHDERVAYLHEVAFPFVAFGRTELGIEHPFVDEDGRAGLALITQHLIDLGHRRIAYITADPEFMFAHLRLLGYRETLERNGVRVDEALIVPGDLTQRSGRQAAYHLLDLPDPPTAIMAANDLMALGAMAAIQARGLNVGTDVAVTGFDDIPLAEHFHPPLTTVRQPIYQIGKMVCQMLIRLLQGNPLEETHVILQPTLVVRASTGKMPRREGEAAV